MLSVRIICVGRLKEPYLKAAEKEYSKRLSPFIKLEILELPEQRPSSGSPNLSCEASAILKNLRKNEFICALCIEGQQIPSESFAIRLRDLMTGGTSAVTFIIGGSHGLSDEIKNAADLKLSLSEMTFPHHLARIMLLEQIYRTQMILSGTEYHK